VQTAYTAVALEGRCHAEARADALPTQDALVTLSVVTQLPAVLLPGQPVLLLAVGVFLGKLLWVMAAGSRVAAPADVGNAGGRPNNTAKKALNQSA
jgi:hypothetical protein